MGMFVISLVIGHQVDVSSHVIGRLHCAVTSLSADIHTQIPMNVVTKILSVLNTQELQYALYKHIPQLCRHKGVTTRNLIGIVKTCEF